MDDFVTVGEAAAAAEHPPQNECEHDWITNRFNESPRFVRVCRWCGLGQGRDIEDGPWEFFTQLHGEGLSPRPPLSRGTADGDPLGLLTAFTEIDQQAECIRVALRKLDRFDPDRQAAGEALGFFIYKARKDAE